MAAAFLDYIRRKEASALSIVLMVLIILSSLIMLYYGMLHVTNQTLIREVNYYRASLNAESAIYYGLRLPELRSLSDSYRLKEKDLDAELFRYRIGFSEHLVGIGHGASKTDVYRLAIRGKQYPLFNNTAMITSALSFFNPLYVTGKTEIKGNLITGRYGLSSQSIKDLYFTGKHLIEGKVFKKSKPQIPKLKLKALDQVLNSSFKRIETMDSILYLNFGSYTIESENVKKIIGPGTVKFKRLPKSLTEIQYSNVIVDDALDLDSKQLKIIESMLYSNSELHLKGEYEHCQFISREKITLESLTKLKKMNLLMLIGSEKHIKLKKARVHFKAGAQFSGMLFYIPPKNYKPRDHFLPFVLENKSKMKGLIFSPYGINPAIALEGVILLNYFEFTYKGTRIQNWIKDLNSLAIDEQWYYDVFDEKSTNQLIQSYEIN